MNKYRLKDVSFYVTPYPHKKRAVISVALIFKSGRVKTYFDVSNHSLSRLLQIVTSIGMQIAPTSYGGVLFRAEKK